MAYMTLVALCGLCGVTFHANPHAVPCFPCRNYALHPEGAQTPVCESCFERINDFREANGLPRHRMPHGAYEASDES